MKKKIVIPMFIFACVFFLAGCTKTSLTGGNTGAANTPPAGMGTPPTDGGTPPSDGGTPPSDGGAPSNDAPTGGPSGN